VRQASLQPGLQVRWRNRVTGVTPDADGASLEIETPEGPYRLHCDWLVVCDGARSPIRHALGLESHGQVFRDKFLIADVVMKVDYPTERWFWFDPPFHPGQSVLLHRQADNLWRVDFQLGWDADPEQEKQPERVLPRLRAMLGEREFELEWVSVYTFQCRRMERFRHGHVLFSGDAAHQVSPFGARGANSGIQDADALAWRLAAVVRNQADPVVLDHWATERESAADENILNSTRSTDFITPKSAMAHAFREATLELAATLPFARRLVNSGRLSIPATADRSPAVTTDPVDDDRSDWVAPSMRPGSPSVDAPLTDPDGQPTWWLRHIGGQFDLLVCVEGDIDPPLKAAIQLIARDAAAGGLPDLAVHWVLHQPDDSPGASTEEPEFRSRLLIDRAGLLWRRCDARHGTPYLLRPDQHVCARWRTPDAAVIVTALRRTLGR
jgi:3-(3-hydroxy-phenyl)propionate hydroxylase